MEPFLRQAFRLVRSGGFCVFFYDLDWHEYLQSTAEAVGWKVQRWPLIAHKTSACQNNAAQFNFTKNYESAMVLRKDERTVLRSQQPSSVWMGDFAAERRLYNNPFAKPFELWKWIYSAISFPGQTVLDTFCGEMSSSRAAVNCGLHPFGWEIKEQHFNRGLQHMQAAYALLHKSNVEFV
jgi:DNA modification methylase